jgi:hypothetical protein
LQVHGVDDGQVLRLLAADRHRLCETASATPGPRTAVRKPDQESEQALVDFDVVLKQWFEHEDCSFDFRFCATACAEHFAHPGPAIGSTRPKSFCLTSPTIDYWWRLDATDFAAAFSVNTISHVFS